MPFEVFSHSYELLFAFCGTAYCGWQRQTDVSETVQQTMEEILRRLFHDPHLNLTACSRTDAGVHALGMKASFHTSSRIPPEELKNYLVKQLPHDVRILNVSEKTPGYNTHEHCCGKAYVYAVHLRSHSLFLKEKVWDWDFEPDPAALREALALFPGTHDFRNFSARKKADENTVRTIWRAEVQAFGPILCFYFSGNGFLHKMIRRILGLLEGTAKGTLSAEEVKEWIDSPGKGVVEQVAPACGLYLKRSFEAPDEWKTDRLESPPFFF